MTGAIKWQPYLWAEPRLVAPGELEQLEKQLGVSFPESYKQLVSRYQGMAPEPSLFNVEGGKNIFCALLTVSTFEEHESYSMLSTYELLKPCLPVDIYPFATTGGTGYICFDYRNAASQPTVVFVTMAATVHPIAASFEEFLEGLHEDTAKT